MRLRTPRCSARSFARDPPPGKPRLPEVAERVLRLYEEWGKKDKEKAKDKETITTFDKLKALWREILKQAEKK